MRRNRLVPVVRAAAVAALLAALAAAPASAGGPTSVLLSVPGVGTTSLYYTDAEYAELSALVGVDRTGGTFAQDTSGTDHAQGDGVTMTWLIHDVDPWRIDRVYLDAQGGPWISTQATNARSLAQADPVWHRPADSKALTALLDRLGIGTGAAADPGASGIAEQPAPDIDEPATSGPTTIVSDPEPTAGTTSAWAFAAWALGGLLVGVLVTVAAPRLRRRARPSPTRPEAPQGSEAYADVLAR